MWKNIRKALLFLTVFAVLFLGLTPVFVPKSNSPGSGIHEFNAKGFLGEQEDTIDVLFLGDSEAYSAFIPLRIWEDRGITSYVCSTGDQMMYQAYSYLEWVLRSQSPKVLFLETNALYRTFTLDQMLSHAMEEVFPFLRYHDRWKDLNPDDFFRSPEHTHRVESKGYLYFDKTVAADTAGYMTPSEEIEPIPLLNAAYLRRIQELCAEYGVELILISTPSPTNWSYYYHNGVEQLSRELDVPYMDMNLMPEQIPIDWEKDSYDGGDHLNYYGACKVTDYISAYLSRMDGFTDKREHAQYESWHADAKAFHQLLGSGK